MQEFSFKNQFGDELYGHKWEIESPNKILIIVTGMAEHSARYDDFATFLNKNGFSCYCLDHYGQGKNGELMNPGKDYFFKMQDTIKEMSESLRASFNLPVYLLAHSMGSFITQGYIEKYSSTIDKVVLVGSNGRNPLVKIGHLIANMMVNDKNYNEKAKFLYNLSLGAYEKSVKNRKLDCEWISYNEENYLKYNEDPLSGVRPTNGFFKEFLEGLSSIQKTKNIKNIRKDLPIYIIGGEDDPVGNNGKGLIKLFKLYSKNGLNAKLKLYAKMRHEILNEKDNLTVYNDVLSFFLE